MPVDTKVYHIRQKHVPGGNIYMFSDSDYLHHNANALGFQLEFHIHENHHLNLFLYEPDNEYQYYIFLPQVDCMEGILLPHYH
ncbi:hypothetical protein M976_03380 [Buttiauxella ferragutiae ATCC 51602]|uniref:Uncharacterized protein n=2 Tax=Buttiauxella TaxID=82976 RepID=A0A1B7IRV1_9ENTR|nr:hypothetical protein M976_03380 [Buttiauxella ferragutiae ATCC 51602]OAT32494.1 hypothetical protein M975_1430 [Buttiauxella brennerae ATCC 51605]